MDGNTTSPHDTTTLSGLDSPATTHLLHGFDLQAPLSPNPNKPVPLLNLDRLNKTMLVQDEASISKANNDMLLSLYRNSFLGKKREIITKQANQPKQAASKDVFQFRPVLSRQSLESHGMENGMSQRELGGIEERMNSRYGGGEAEVIVGA